MYVLACGGVAAAVFSIQHACSTATETRSTMAAKQNLPPPLETTNFSAGEQTQLFLKMASLVSEVKCNLQELVGDWHLFQHELQSDALQNRASASVVAGKGDQQQLMVNKADLECLVTEAMMLKEFLPRVLTTEYLTSFSKLTQIDQELQMVVQEKEGLSSEHEHLKRRTEAIMADYEHEKQEKFKAKCEVSTLSQQLSQQAEYCSSMGAACCTLLWRVSRHEDCIHSILSGSKVSEFLQLVSSTLQSYLATYSDSGMPDEGSEEAQFVLALCGIITNIGASAYGRDFLASSPDGQALMEMFCSLLADAPTGHECAKLKSLVLMSLYNISINQKGLKFLTSQPDLMRVLVWLLQEEADSTNRLHTIRLLQSMILEPETPAIIHQALEALPLPLLQHLAADPNPEIRETALELMSDLHAMQREP